MKTPLIEASGLTRNHSAQPGVVAGIADLDLCVARGEFVVVQGASGSGKSTLLLLLGALSRPQRGTLRIDGVDLGGIDAAGRARFRSESVGFVFQLFHLVPYLTVHQNVMAGLPDGRMDHRQGAEEAERWLRELGLTDRRQAQPATLSAGERQRVALARALIKRPPLILADEPTGNLDPANAVRVLQHLEDYRRSGGTVVLVTHGAEADRFATQRLRLEAGRRVDPVPLSPVHPSLP